MSSELKELLDHVAALQVKIDEARSLNRANALADVRDDIKLYDLRKEELFSFRTDRDTGHAIKAPRTKSTRAPKYSDGKGQTWVGRGKRPEWLNAALADGKLLESFLIV